MKAYFHDVAWRIQLVAACCGNDRALFMYLVGIFCLGTIYLGNNAQVGVHLKSGADKPILKAY